MNLENPGVDIRLPSTANLLVDSADRNTANYPNANNFQIVKTNSILNGYFTRVGTTEVVLEYNTPNVYLGQYFVQYNTNLGQEGLIIPDGFYTVEELINLLVEGLNGYTAIQHLAWAATATIGGGATLTPTTSGGPAPTYWTLAGPLIGLLFGTTPVGSTLSVTPSVSTTTAAIDLRPFRYLDICAPSLTYAQDLKDASTANFVRDVLVRWYFDYDQPVALDGYGYPILMGYKPFYLRRTYSPPKQSQWKNNLPIGNLTFQVYGNDGQLANITTDTNFLLTLQVSEV